MGSSQSSRIDKIDEYTFPYYMDTHIIYNILVNAKEWFLKVHHSIRLSPYHQFFH